MSVEITIEERMDLLESELERHTAWIGKLDRLVYKLFKLRKEPYVSKARARRELTPETPEHE